jgi:nitrous oxidase accessory protein NosD
MKKLVVIVAIVLFLCSSISVPAFSGVKNILPSTRGDTLYVGGSGPGNYSKIQDAVNDSFPGDTVFVYRGSYNESVRITVMNLSLIGEGAGITTIANRVSVGIYVEQPECQIQGFKILNGDPISGAGIFVNKPVRFTEIRDMNFSKTGHGVLLTGKCSWSNIHGNIFHDCFTGIQFGYDKDNLCNTVKNNIFTNNSIGMYMEGEYFDIYYNSFIDCRQQGVDSYARHSTFKYNEFKGNKKGLTACFSNVIYGNTFKANEVALLLDMVSDSSINNNNFIRNKRDATFFESNSSASNNWDRNYWGHPMLHAKIILGSRVSNIPRLFQFGPGTSYYHVPCIRYDRYPSMTPNVLAADN